jgi:hypothetical protein
MTTMVMVLQRLTGAFFLASRHLMQAVIAADILTVQVETTAAR